VSRRPSCRVADLTADRTGWIDQAAVLLHTSFRNRSRDWQDLDSARRTVVESLEPEKISRVALVDENDVVGWIGGQPMYDGRVWEIHPLVVAERHRRRGVGRELVADLERLSAQRGALTLYAGSDDENGETSLSGIDLYADISGAIRNIRNVKGHPYEFYMKLGFRIVGVMPDANGRGKPDIFLAKRVERRA
jgi:aminoglycoside 6'-N-acetyltransferase I